jgi:hypothetical protein
VIGSSYNIDEPDTCSTIRILKTVTCKYNILRIPIQQQQTMNTNNTTANTTTFPDSWDDLLNLDQPLDFEAFLNSDLLATRRNQIKTRGVIFHTLGSVSTIASTCLAVHILRSHHGLSTTYHRLVFGLCIGDIMSSFANVLGSTMVPKEMNYFVPGAQGNMTTCTAQGFLIAVGSIAANLYNCSICLYYLSIIRYNKKDEYIRNKLEPWFHAISIIGPLAGGFIAIAMKAYNVTDSVCFFQTFDAPHCIGYESGDTPEGFSTPCGRGDGGENPILYLLTIIVGFGSTMIITPMAIVGTTLLMYRSVSKIEKNMQNYGVNALRLNVRSGGGNRGNNAATNSTRSQGIMSRIMRSFLMCMTPRCLHRRDDQPRPTSRSNRATSQKRAILHMATGYALAWTFVFIPFMIPFFLHESHVTLIISACLTPLQGLFNFLVFMSPKVRSAKQPRRGENFLTWHQAFIKAYMSRGLRRRTGRNLSSRNTRTGTITSRLLSSLKSLLSRTKRTRVTRSNVESNACTTTNHQSSNPEQDTSAPTEKLTSSNPHLHGVATMKEDEEDNRMRPQQQESLVKDEEEK